MRPGEQLAQLRLLLRPDDRQPRVLEPGRSAHVGEGCIGNRIIQERPPVGVSPKDRGMQLPVDSGGPGEPIRADHRQQVMIGPIGQQAHICRHPQDFDGQPQIQQCSAARQQHLTMIRVARRQLPRHIGPQLDRCCGAAKMPRLAVVQRRRRHRSQHDRLAARPRSERPPAADRWSRFTPWALDAGATSARRRDSCPDNHFQRAPGPPRRPRGERPQYTGNLTHTERHPAVSIDDCACHSGSHAQRSTHDRRIIAAPRTRRHHWPTQPHSND